MLVVTATEVPALAIATVAGAILALQARRIVWSWIALPSGGAYSLLGDLSLLLRRVRTANVERVSFYEPLDCR
jgi:hypothetical protein